MLTLNIWLVFWLVLAVLLLGFLAWTFLILMRQKSAWKVYAGKRKIRYKSGPLMMSPSLQGSIGDHTVDVFSSEHLVEDARGSRKLTAVEVSLNSVMPVTGGVASGGMIPILKGLDLKQEYFPKFKAWKKSYVAAGANKGVLAAYLSDARLEALCGLMEIKNAWVILVFKDEAMLLRVDTPDPLDSAAALDKVVKQMLAAAKLLELKAGESERLKSEEVKAAAKNISLAVDDEAMDGAGSSFELEDEGVLVDQDSDENDVAVPAGALPDDESEKP